MKTIQTHGDRRNLLRRRRALAVLSVIATVTIAAAGCRRSEPAPVAAAEPPAAEAPLPDQAAPTAQPAEPAARSAQPADAPAPRSSKPSAEAVAAELAATPPPAAAPAPPPAPPPPPKPRVAHLNAGDVITIRTTRELSTKSAKAGDVFSAILEEPIKSGSWVVAAGGAKVDGRVVEADKGGRVKGKANLSIELTSLTLADGSKIDLVTSPVNHEAAAAKGKNAAKVGIAAGTGAAIGAIAGGGKGAAIGAIAGGGVGALARGEAADIPAESVIGFELRSPITVEEKLR